MTIDLTTSAGLGAAVSFAFALVFAVLPPARKWFEGNVGGYVGESTRSEIEYAREHGKSIRWLEPSLTY